MAGDALESSKEKLKILITHFQISSSFKYNLDMEFPWPEIDNINGLFSWVNLDAIDLANLECVQPMNFYDGLFATVLSSTMVLCVVPLTCVAVLALQALAWKLGLRELTTKAQRIRHAFIDRSWNLFLMLCFFFFPPVSKRVFQTLHCVEIHPGEYYMWTDLSLRCWQETHWWWVGFSIGSMVVYTAGIPLFFVFILYSNQRRLLLQTPQCQNRYGFLYAKYQDRVWWWEIIEMFRKLMFTSIIMFLSNGPSSQIVMAMGIAFVALILHLHTQAYKEEADSWLQSASLIAIFVTLWVGLLHKTNVTMELDEAGGIGSEVYRWVTVTVSSFPVFVAVGGLLAKTSKVVTKFFELCCQSSLCPDMGVLSAIKLFTPGAGFEAKQSAALSLALAVNTDAAGDLILQGNSKLESRKEKRSQRRMSATEQRTAAASNEEKLNEQFRVHAEAARRGKPIVKSDRRRRLFLLPLRLSADAIVLRNYPIGKGFIVALPEDDRYLTEEEDEGRPAFMFVKCWQMSYSRLTGHVYVKYDVRDTGWRLEREHVSYHPETPNKELLVWEAKKAMGALSLGQIVGVKKSALKFSGKIGPLKTRATTSMTSMMMALAKNKCRPTAA